MQAQGSTQTKTKTEGENISAGTFKDLKCSKWFYSCGCTCVAECLRGLLRLKPELTVVYLNKKSTQ